jgi:hypothetical protein
VSPSGVPLANTMRGGDSLKFSSSSEISGGIRTADDHSSRNLERLHCSAALRRRSAKSSVNARSSNRRSIPDGSSVRISGAPPIPPTSCHHAISNCAARAAPSSSP